MKLRLNTVNKIGKLYIDDVYFCDTIKGDNFIENGTYNVKVILTPDMKREMVKITTNKDNYIFSGGNITENELKEIQLGIYDDGELTKTKESEIELVRLLRVKPRITIDIK